MINPLVGGCLIILVVAGLFAGFIALLLSGHFMLAVAVFAILIVIVAVARMGAPRE